MNVIVIKEQRGKFHNVKLSAPISYWKKSKKWIKKHTNGMGADNPIVNLFPQKLRNSLLGLDVSEAAYIHDYMYGLIIQGFTRELYQALKDEADSLFLKNLIALCKANYAKELQSVKWFPHLQKWFIKRRFKARIKLSNVMYEAVVEYGEDAFFKGKTDDKRRITTA